MDAFTKTLLALIAIFLGIIAVGPFVRPAPVHADSDYSYLYVEPRTTLLRQPDGSRQLEGKMVIDMRNGDIWGFPTLSSTPYPVDTMNTVPPVVSPMYLGRFDFSKMTAVERERAFKH